MFASESREYFTLQESDGSVCACVNCTTNKRTRHTKCQKNFLVDPTNSSSSHKYKTPYSSSCPSDVNDEPSPRSYKNNVICIEKSKSPRSRHHRRSRSLCIHFRPANQNSSPKPHRRSRTSKCDGCRKAQVAQSPCHSKWGPVYQPPLNLIKSNESRSNATIVSSSAQCGVFGQISHLSLQRTCPVYQPEQQTSLDTFDKEEIYPDRVAHNLNEDRRQQRHQDKTEFCGFFQDPEIETRSESGREDFSDPCDVFDHEASQESPRDYQNVWKIGHYDPVTELNEGQGSECGPSLFKQVHNRNDDGEMRQKRTNYFNGDRVHFTCVNDLPKPSEVRQLANQKDRKRNKLKHHHHHRHHENRQILESLKKTNPLKNVPCSSLDDKNIFPFRKTTSGNLKIFRNQVAFQSKQVVVLVNDPRRTRVKLKQERDCPQPPPVPPLCFDDLPSPPCDSSRRKPEHRHHEEKPPRSARSEPKKRSKPCSRPPPCTFNKRRSRKEKLEKSHHVPCLDFETQNQCRNSTDFIESLQYRLRRAIHPDTKIIIGSQEFPCHSLALQAYSKYFDCIKRPIETIHRINLPEEIIKAQDFPNLMDWILLDENSKFLVISKDNVVALYSAAQCLGIPGLKEHCLAFINEKIESCDPIILQLYEDARSKSTWCKHLLSSLSPKLAHLFPILYKSRQFLSLSTDELIMLIDSDDVKIQSELDIYDAAARWLLYDWSNRKQFAIRVMKCVRFGLLTPLQLTQIRHCAEAANIPDYSHIYSFQEIKDLLCDGLTYAIFKENYKSRPGEFNKWIDWSKVHAPRPRFNVDGNPDVFRLPAKIPVDGYPSYDEFEKELPHNKFIGAQGCNSNTAVRDEGSTPRHQNDLDSVPITPRLPQVPLPSFMGLGHSQGDSHKDDLEEKKNSSLQGTDAFERMSETIVEPESNFEDPQNYQTTTTKSLYTMPMGSPRKSKLLLNSIASSTKKYGKMHYRAAIKIQACYRGHLIRKQFLEMKHAAIVIQSFFRLFLYKKRQRKLQEYHRSKISLNKTDRVKKLLIPGQEVVVVFGGMNPQDDLGGQNNCCTVYRFSPEENIWTDMGLMPEPRSHCGVVYDEKSIILFGGSDPRNQTSQGRNVPSTSCWSLDPITGKWRTLPGMKIARTNFGYAKWRGKIFVFGGKDIHGQTLSSCEKFDPSLGPNGKWDLIPPMQVPCMSMAVSRFGNKIFVVGGITLVTKGGKRPILKTVLVYEPKTNSWSHQTALKYGRCYAQLVSHYNQLFLVGGAGKNSSEGTQSLQDVTVFDDGEWEQVGKLKRARHGHSMVKMGKHLLIMGGVSSESMEPLDTVEIYNTETNRTSMKVSSMPQKLTGMTAVVL